MIVSYFLLLLLLLLFCMLLLLLFECRSLEHLLCLVCLECESYEHCFMYIFPIAFVMSANHLSVPMVLSDPGKFRLSEDEKQKLEGKLQPLSLSGFPRQTNKQTKKLINFVPCFCMKNLLFSTQVKIQTCGMSLWKNVDIPWTYCGARQIFEIWQNREHVDQVR